MKTTKLSALLVANQLDLKGIKTFFDSKPVADTSSELFYSMGEDRYQYFFNYGVIVFSGFSEEEIKTSLHTISPYQKSPLSITLRDDHEIRVQDGEMEFDFDRLIVNRLELKVVRIAMLNLAQSVALDYYHNVSEGLLEEIRGFTRGLENTGKLSISRKNMMKFIGKALNTQNDIADNIYIFDAPELVWDDEYLDKLHRGLIKYFDLQVRFKEIEYTMRIIEDNLSVFREISNQRESSLLEWIIIALILVELFNLFLPKIL